MRGRIYIENGSHIGQFPFRLVPLLAGFVSPRAISCWRANSSSWMRDAVAARYSRQWCASSAILGRAASSTIAPLRTITSTARSKISDTLVSMSAQRHQLPSPETGRGELRDQRMLTIAGGGTRGIVWVFPAPAGMNRWLAPSRWRRFSVRDAPLARDQDLLTDLSACVPSRARDDQIRYRRSLRALFLPSSRPRRRVRRRQRAGRDEARAWALSREHLGMCDRTR
jgi:hypothetical protein